MANWDRMRLLAACLVLATLNARSQPLADYHQHLFSPAVAKLSTDLQPLNVPPAAQR